MQVNISIDSKGKPDVGLDITRTILKFVVREIQSGTSKGQSFFGGFEASWEVKDPSETIEDTDVEKNFPDNLQILKCYWCPPTA